MFVDMKSIGEIEKQFVQDLSSIYGTEESRSIFFWVLEAVADISRKRYLLLKSRQLEDFQSKKMEEHLTALKSGRPVQYVLGHAWFMGMELAVDESVLIPRPETEELVNLIIGQHADAPVLDVIDIGTGSGCIAIALQKSWPQSSVFGLDVSTNALTIARQNAATHAAGVNFICADILEWELCFQDSQQYDVVVSNPPYITPSEKVDMHSNVLAHEPDLALFVTSEAPLLFYQHIAAFACKHLRKGGKLYFEINRKFGAEVCELLVKLGFVNVQLHQDLYGADRMVAATL